MTTDTDLLSQWYEALDEEDSLQVKALLAAHPSLLKVGWGIEASQFVWKGDPWKERTALHVGVRRGNAELVEQVLKLCKVVIRKYSTKEDEDGRRCTGQPDLAETKEAQTNDNNIADPSQDNTTGEGDRQPAKSTRSAVADQSVSRSDGQPANKTGAPDGSPNFQDGVPSISRSEPEEVDQSREIARLAVADWKRLVDHTGSASGGLGFRNAVSSIRQSKRDGDEKSREIARLAVDKWKRRVDDSSFVREHPNGKERTLLDCKDGRYKLTAFAMAVLYGNRKIILMLLYAMGRNRLPALDVTEESEKDREHRANLRGATERVVHELSGAHSWAEYLRLYEEDRDFNFLPWQEYLFHFSLCQYQREGTPALHFARALWTAVRSCSDSTWRFLLKLQDGQGRTPLSAAIDRYCSGNIVRILGSDEGKGEAEHEVAQCAMTACDGAGRTAVHYAFGIGQYSALRDLLDFAGGGKKLAPLVRKQWRHPIPSVVQAWTNDGRLVGYMADSQTGLGDGTVCDNEEPAAWTVEASPLQSAILHSGLWRLHRSYDKLSKFVEDWGLETVFRWSYWTPMDRRSLSKKSVELHAAELAALVGDPEEMRYLPLGAYHLNSKLHLSRTEEKWPWPALHIAANAGNYDMLKLILDDPDCDPYVEDWDGNSALHHALKVIHIVKFEPNLMHFVNIEHIEKWRHDLIDKQEISHDDALAERKGCINLLLQAGCDIFKTNKKKQPPYPQGELSRNSNFLSWWYTRQATEFDSAQRTLSSAANAISVTATLVATASYVGPLQPPMGIAGDLSQIQDANLWVRIFIFCDTMSFYLAIVAITLSLIPSIPVPQQQMKDEVQRTRFMVAMAVTLLFPSIIFVLTAFISSSIAVVSANPTSTGGSLTIITASIGGFLCILTFSLFSLRLLAFIFPKSKHVKKIYNATNWTVPF